MVKIFFPTRVRGFFKHLFLNNTIKHNFTYDNSKMFEISNSKSKFISKIVRSNLFDKLGLIQKIKSEKKDIDIFGSFNRFLNVDKPYFIYLENPTALYHYSLERNQTYLGKKNIRKSINDKNLKVIACMSVACKDTFSKVCLAENKHNTKLEVIYPYVPKNDLVGRELLLSRTKEKKIKLLYVAQGSRFVSKGGLEIIEALIKLNEKYKDKLTLTIVTSIDDIEDEIKKKISSIDNIDLLNFNFSYEEMQKLYSSNSILLHPTSDDSFGLTILEAMKAGLPVISTKLYAIPEMVKDNTNGYLTEPKWWFFDKNNIPNPEIWNNRKATIYLNQLDMRIVNFLYEKVEIMLNDRKLLFEMSLNSHQISNSPPFDETTIANQWDELIWYTYNKGDN